MRAARTAAETIRGRRPLLLPATLVLVALAVACGPVGPASAEVSPGSGTSAAGQADGNAGQGGQAGTPPVPIRANLPDLEDEVMCPICGTLLSMSRAPAAERQRAFMRGLILEGKTNDEVKDALVAEYGPQVLGLPDDDEINFFVYLVPLFGLILAALGVLWAAIRWRRGRGPDDPEPATGGESAGGPGASESARLDRDLAEFDR
jgi:cytochrome c-type biogenesis protein CcmH